MPVNGCNCFFRGVLEDGIEINCRRRSRNNNKVQRGRNRSRGVPFCFILFCFVLLNFNWEESAYRIIRSKRWDCYVCGWMDGWMACVRARCDSFGWYDIASVAGTVARRYNHIIISGSWCSVNIGDRKKHRKEIEICEVDAVSIWSVCVGVLVIGWQYRNTPMALLLLDRKQRQQQE